MPTSVRIRSRSSSGTSGGAVVVAPPAIGVGPAGLLALLDVALEAPGRSLVDRRRRLDPVAEQLAPAEHEERDALSSRLKTNELSEQQRRVARRGRCARRRR